MLNFTLTEEQELLKELARKFAKEEVIPRASHYDSTGEYPHDLIKKAWEVGLMNSHVPEKFGGPGLGVMEGCIISENVAWGCSGVSTAMEANSLASAPLIVAASDEIKKEFLGR